MRQDSGGTKCIAMGRVVWVGAGKVLEASMAVEESRVENAMIIFCFHINIVSVVGAHGEGGVGGGREGVSPRPPHHLRHRLQLRPSSQSETATYLLLNDKSSTTSKSLLFGNTLSNRLT